MSSEVLRSGDRFDEFLLTIFQKYFLGKEWRVEIALFIQGEGTSRMGSRIAGLGDLPAGRLGATSYTL